MKFDVCDAINVGQYAAISVQTDVVLKWVQLGLAIACSVVLLAYRLWKWWKEAKKDGKITKEEIKEGLDIVKDGLEDVKHTIDDKEVK